MQTLIFATNNQHKVEEIKHVIKNSIHVISLKEANINIDIPEPYETIQENAATKAKTIHELTKQNCFAEDTGLEVEALNNEPGVRSARYAGDSKNFQQNIDKLLHNLSAYKNRSAQFRTVIALIWNNKEYFFEGICKGTITNEQKGTNGFGYDPIFIPEGSNKTFAEMKLEEKNVFSHRKKATDKLIAFLSSIE